MPCDPEILRNVPLFALLDEDEVAVLAGQVENQEFRPSTAHLQNGRPERTRLHPGFRQRARDDRG